MCPHTRAHVCTLLQIVQLGLEARTPQKERERWIWEATAPGLFPFELRTELGPKVFHSLI